MPCKYCCYFVKFFLSSSGPVQRVIYSYEMTSENYHKVVLDMISDWTAMCNLYTVVRQFADCYDGKRNFCLILCSQNIKARARLFENSDVVSKVLLHRK